MQALSPRPVPNITTHLAPPQLAHFAHPPPHHPPPHIVHSRAQPLPNSRIIQTQGIPVGHTITHGPPQGYPIQTLPFSPQPYSIPPPYQVAPVAFVQPPPRAPLNFDYAEAEFLCDAKIIENTVHCVICNEDYKSSEKAEHLLKHRRHNSRPIYNKETLEKVSQYKSQQHAFKKHMVRPVVPPETHVVDFKPNSYELIRETLYEDEDRMERIERAIGPGDDDLKPVNFRYQQSNMSNNSMNEPVNWYNSGEPGYPSEILSPKNLDRNQWANSQYGTGVNYAPRAQALNDGDNVDSQDTLYPRNSNDRPNSYQPNNSMVNSMNEPVNWYNHNEEPYPGGNTGNYQSYGKSQETNYPQNSMRNSNGPYDNRKSYEPDKPIIYEEDRSNSQLDNSIDKATPRGQHHPEENVRQSQPNNNYNDPYSPGLRQSNDPRSSNDPYHAGQSNEPYSQRQPSYHEPSQSGVAGSNDPYQPSQSNPNDHYQPTNNRNSNDPYDSSVRSPNNPDPYNSPLRQNNSSNPPPNQNEPVGRHTERNAPSEFSEPMSIKDSSGQSEMRASNILEELGMGGGRAQTGRRRIASQAEW